MILALLLAAQVAGPTVERLPQGGERITLAFEGPKWTEVRVALGTPADPPGRSGLGAVAAQVMQARLRTDTRLRPTLRVRRSREGLSVSFGVPSDQLNAVLPEVLGRLLPDALTTAEVDHAVDAAARARQALLQSDEALADLEIERRLLGRSPPLGEVEEIAQVTREEVLSWIGPALRRTRTALVLTGDVPETGAADWLEALPGTPTATTAPGAVAARPTVDDRIEIIIVDKPGRAQAQVRLGWATPGVRSEVSPTVAAAVISARAGNGTEAQWRPPMLVLSRTSSIGSEPDVLRGLVRLADEARSRPIEARQWLAGVTTATAAIDLQLKDSVAAADTLAADRLDPQRTLRTVLQDRIRAQAEPPAERLSGLWPEQGRVAVIVTSVTRDLLERLSALSGVGRISVVAWDNR